MSSPTAPSSATTVDAGVAEPLLRDPPSPPGYVDPLEGSATLQNLVASSARAVRPLVGSGTHNG